MTEHWKLKMVIEMREKQQIYLYLFCLKNIICELKILKMYLRVAYVSLNLTVSINV